MHAPPRTPRLVVVAPTLLEAEVWFRDNAAAAGIDPQDYIPLYLSPNTSERLYGLVLRPGDRVIWHPTLLEVTRGAYDRLYAALYGSAAAGNAHLTAGGKVVAQ